MPFPFYIRITLMARKSRTEMSAQGSTMRRSDFVLVTSFVYKCLPEGIHDDRQRDTNKCRV
jgi:hypothetical protein